MQKNKSMSMLYVMHKVAAGYMNMHMCTIQHCRLTFYGEQSGLLDNQTLNKQDSTIITAPPKMPKQWTYITH